MNAFLYGIGLQWRLDLRNKEIFLTYYAVPLVFFAFMGGILSSINPMAQDTLIASMTVFGINMGAMLGAPVPVAELYGSPVKKAYQVGGIPMWAGVVNNFISAFVHLFLMSLVIFFAAPLVFQATVPTDLGGYFGSLALFLTACIGIATLLGLCIRSTSKLTMASQVIFLPSIMLSGIMLPNELLPRALVIAGKAFPATWGFEALKGGADSTLGLWILAGISAAAFVACAIKLNRIKKA